MPSEPQSDRTFPTDVLGHETWMGDAEPVGPGDLLREEIIARAGVTQEDLAEALGVSRLTVNHIINGKRTVTAEMAVRLGHVLGTSPELWLNLQREIDLYRAHHKLAPLLAKLPILRRS